MGQIVEVRNLSKEYTIKKRDSNEKFIKRLFHSGSNKNYALDNVSFSIDEGALVGLIGANGAGKSTTIKILTGILHPSAGTVRVHGKDPMSCRKVNSYRFGLMMGQRSQLWWDLPAKDSFELYRRMYGVSKADFNEMMKLFNDILELETFINKPVRQLSLGQRIRCEFGVTFLHRPSVVFLDEPTIGIDILAKERIFSFIRYINKEWNSTVILTTHDISDMEKMTDRAMILDTGKLIYDGSFSALKQLETSRNIEVEFSEEVKDIYIPNVQVIIKSPFKVAIVYDRSKTSITEIMTIILNKYPVSDITLQSPDIETVVRKIYEGHMVEDGGMI